MLRKVHLHGSLAKHGDVFEFDVLTAAEALAALAANVPEFLGDLREGSWVILRGDPDTGLALDEDAVVSMRLGNADLHIMPEIMGAKNSSGALKAILGIALIAITAGSAAPFLANPIIAGAGATWGNVIGQMGLAMALTGVSSMLAPETESDSKDDESFTMTGPVSRYGQGNAIPIVYGEVITGGVLVSGGIDADGLESVTDKKKEDSRPELIETAFDNFDFGP